MKAQALKINMALPYVLNERRWTWRRLHETSDPTLCITQSKGCTNPALNSIFVLCISTGVLIISIGSYCVCQESCHQLYHCNYFYVSVSAKILSFRRSHRKIFVC